MSAAAPLYALLAEFAAPPELLRAVKGAREAGYTILEAYTPYPMEEVSEALGHHRSKLPAIVLGGGLVGAAAGFGLQYWSSVLAYPLNVGGRPFNSWPSFIPVTFEMTILVASVAAVLGMLALNGLPMPYHPMFHVERFKLASRDRYFLAVSSRDPLFDAQRTRTFLEGLDATGVFDVPP